MRSPSEFLYNLARQLEEQEYWRKKLTTSEHHHVSQALSSLETWHAFLNNEEDVDTNSGLEDNLTRRVCLSMRVRTALFDRVIPLLWPDVEVSNWQTSEVCIRVIISKFVGRRANNSIKLRADGVYRVQDEVDEHIMDCVFSDDGSGKLRYVCEGVWMVVVVLLM